MRLAYVPLCLLTFTACAPVASTDGATENALGAPAGNDGKPACSLAYWSWLNQTYVPLLDSSIDQVSDADLATAAAKKPDMGETASSYGICWRGVFDTHFYGPAFARVHDANASFVDSTSTAYQSYDAFIANATMTPELRRNAKAILALRPSTLSEADFQIWLGAYASFIGATISPVGIPAQAGYTNVVEAEWVIDSAEAEYLTVMEAARADSTADGVFGDWMSSYSDWMFGPSPTVTSRSTVFNVPWESGADGDTGLSGVDISSGTPVLPSAVQAFITLLTSSRPKAIGSTDSATWMSKFNARVLAALSGASHNEPVLDATDDLAVQVIEQQMPATLMGRAAYQTWLNLFTQPDVMASDAWRTRVMKAKPCVTSDDLELANSAFSAKTASVGQTLPGAEPAACQ